MPTPLTRRSFLGRATLAGAGLVAVGGLSELLAACGDDSSDASSSGASGTSTGTTSLSYQLSWIPTVTCAGSFVADTDGYYEKQHTKVKLMPGGPSVQVDGVVQSGKCLIGKSSPEATAAANAKGADLVIVGTLYQRSPFCILSKADDPIVEPHDLYGKKLGMPAADLTAWNTFVGLNDLDESKITLVPAQFDPTPLVAGEVQAFMGYATDQPSKLKQQGIETEVLLMEDFGYHCAGESYVVERGSLSGEDRQTIVNFLRGELKGWQDVVADPTDGARLAVDKYGKNLKMDLDQQLAQAKAQNELIVSDDTKAHGLAFMSDELLTNTLDTLAKAKVEADESLFVADVLAEVYDGKATL